MATKATITAEWDTSLTYDVLLATKPRIPTFVGRDDLLQPLVASICETRKRGTILISGHRGTGKTTLLIEALRRARGELEKKPDESGKQWHLLPIVLNVSEVSASLVAPPSDDKADQKPASLSIDPKRLLIALMRSFAHQSLHNPALRPDAPAQVTKARGLAAVKKYLARLRRDGPPLVSPRARAMGELRDLIDGFYIKAIAAEFSRTREGSDERTRSQSIEAEASKLEALLWPLATLLTGAATLAFCFISFDLTMLARRSIIAAAGLIATIGLSVKWKLSTTTTKTRAEKFVYKFDNSLQQIENDLRDLLDRLQDLGFRTVVVLEELDKLDRTANTQLDSVVRYFKNLFTQAPALFFFVTDKTYFDAIAASIREARRRRSYAVEHTFFSSRIFVGRPATADCVKFVGNILADDADKKIVELIYTSDRYSTESFGSETPQKELLSLFTRVLLFRAANHLFDLKNELRRYARQQKDGSVALVFPEAMFPPEEQALAKFQDLIAEKFRAFEIKGGRAYANEVLNDCLYAVFNELGSAVPQSVKELLPLVAPLAAKDRVATSQEPLATASSTPVLAAPPVVTEPFDSLDISELQRIEQAVRSLVDDLSYGSAISVDKSLDTFMWMTDAARTFSPVKRLEEHEKALIQELTRVVEQGKLIVERLSPGDARTALQDFIVQGSARIGQVEDLGATIPLDTAKAEQQALERDFGKLLEPAYIAHRDAASRIFGLSFPSKPHATFDGGASIWIMTTCDGTPAPTDSREFGCVVFAHGKNSNLFGDAVKLAQSRTALKKLAIVHVLPPGSSEEDCRQAEAQYIQAAQPPQPDAEASSGTAGVTTRRGLLDFRIRPKALTLDEPGVNWGKRLGEELVAASQWATFGEKNLAPTGPYLSDLNIKVQELLSYDSDQDMAVVVSGVTEPDFFMPVLARTLQDYGSDVSTFVLAPTETGDVVLDDQQKAHLAKALRASTASQISTIGHEFLVERMALDDSAVLVASGPVPLKTVSADRFSRKALIIYVGPYDPKHFGQMASSTVELRPEGQFRTSKGNVGPYASQNLTLHYGKFPRAPSPRLPADVGTPLQTNAPPAPNAPATEDNPFPRTEGSPIREEASPSAAVSSMRGITRFGPDSDGIKQKL